MQEIRWGILGCAKIAQTALIPAIQKSKTGKISALASRNIDKASDWAKKLGVSKAYGSYEELLADKNIDAIYIPLPNHLHVPWSLKCIEANKHVLSEKPLSVRLEEAELLYKKSKEYPKIKTMEAFMYRFHPQWIKLKEMLRSGKVGTLRQIQIHYSYYNTHSENIRNQKETGGGGLLDIGCYAISSSRWLFGKEPKRVSGLIERDPNYGTDRIASAILQFDEGMSVFSCSTQTLGYESVQAIGTEGILEIKKINPLHDMDTTIFYTTRQGTEKIHPGKSDHYENMVDHFAQSIFEDKEVPTPLSDGVANMRCIESIFKSAETKQVVELP